MKYKYLVYPFSCYLNVVTLAKGKRKNEIHRMLFPLHIELLIEIEINKKVNQVRNWYKFEWKCPLLLFQRNENMKM